MNYSFKRVNCYNVHYRIYQSLSTHTIIKIKLFIIFISDSVTVITSSDHIWDRHLFTPITYILLFNLVSILLHLLKLTYEALIGTKCIFNLVNSVYINNVYVY